MRTLPEGTTLARIYFSGGPHPVRWNEFRHYGPTNARFDHHVPDGHGDSRTQDRSVLYCGSDALTCLAEVFQQTRRIDRVRNGPWPKDGSKRKVRIDPVSGEVRR